MYEVKSAMLSTKLVGIELRLSHQEQTFNVVL